MDNYIDKIVEFLHLNEDGKYRLSDKIVEKSFKRGEILDSHRQFAENAYFIISGSARTYFYHNEKEYTFSFSFENDFLLTISDLDFSSQFELNVQFLEDTKVAYFGNSTLKEIFESQGPEHMKFAIGALLSQHYKLRNRLIMFQYMNAKERYEWVCGNYPMVVKKITITQLASFLGLTKETIYRIRNGKYIAK